jgi:hypothetical protein
MGGYFSILIFRDGVMDFCRSKTIHDDVEHLVGELNSSFSFYRGRHRGFELERTYLFNGDKGLADVLKEISRADVVEVRPEHLLSAGEGEFDVDGVNPTTLLAALGAACPH